MKKGDKVYFIENGMIKSYNVFIGIDSDCVCEVTGTEYSDGRYRVRIVFPLSDEMAAIFQGYDVYIIWDNKWISRLNKNDFSCIEKNLYSTEIPLTKQILLDILEEGNKNESNNN